MAFISGCAPSSSSVPISSAAHKLTPTGSPIGLSVPVCRLASCVNFSPVPGIRPFIDTWNNIHVFQTFDRQVHNISDTAKDYDFVWGASLNNVDAYRQGNPHVLLSYYVPQHVDDGTFTNAALGHQRGLPYWQAMYPDWILYQCDRTTPAYEYQYTNIPFNMTNPAVVNWQIQNYFLPASQHGYDAIAADNVIMVNMFHACGYYENGRWVQRYTGKLDDPQWQDDVVGWLIKMEAELHSLSHPLLLIANFTYGDLLLSSNRIQQALMHIDGVLDESGFTHFGEYRLPADQWLQMMHYVDSIQRQNKPFFLINEFQKSTTHSDIEWVLASYLMCKQHLASIYIAPFQGYGVDNRVPEYVLQIGSPRNDMYEAQHVYWREYTHGVVVVNPGDNAVTVSTLPIHPAASFVDPYGASMSPTFSLPAHSAQILLQQ